MTENIHKTLREIRESTGLTQEEFAERVGVARGTVAGAETKTNPGPRYLRKIREAFPTEANAAFGRSDSFEPDDPTALYADEEEEAQSMFAARCTRRPDLTGDWYALWESTADNDEIINSEHLVIKMRRSGRFIIENTEPSPENPKGGYLWRAEGHLFDSRHLLSTYIAREKNVISKGTLYLVLHNSGAFIEGQWIGCNYDGDWARGLVVIARDRDRLPDLLKRLRESFPTLPYNRA